MAGFKSFGDRTVTVKLSPGFTCIVGPNGAGKSNIIDALCFALGRLSKKTMRAEKLSDLIFAGTKNQNAVNKASVTLYFDNSEGIFPGGTDEFQITRVVRRNKGNKYKMNDKIATRQQILDVLASANIDPDGSNQFVLQGKIVELTHMNTEERRKFIEELIGLQKYDDMKEETMQELEKAERELGQFEAIFKEVSSQLKKVTKEKNDALAWKELETKIKEYNAHLIALKISKLKEQEQKLIKEIEEIKNKIEEFEEKINHQKAVLDQETLLMNNIQDTINQKEKERDELNEGITQIKTKLSSNTTKLELAEKRLKKLQEEKEKAENQQIRLEENQTIESLLEEADERAQNIENHIEELKRRIDQLQREQTKFDTQLNSKEQQKTELMNDISDLKQNISSKEASIKALNENVQTNINKQKKLQEEINTLKGDSENVDDAINDAKELENTLRSELEKIKTKISEESAKRKELEEKITSEQEKKNMVNSEIAELQSNLSSLTAKIDIYQENIEKNEKKKDQLEQKIKNLVEGKEVEATIKSLIEERIKLNDSIETDKKKIKALNFDYHEKEKHVDLLNLKQNSLIAEIKDTEAKASNLKTKLNIFSNDLKQLERNENQLVLSIDELKKNNQKNKENKETLNIRKENVQNRIQSLQSERERIKDRIERAEHEYDRDKDDIKGILQILNMLTQNINISVESIKSNIQQSNSEAIEMSAENFENFILDVIEMMKSVEEVSEESDEIREMRERLNSILQTLSIFKENADQTIEQLIYRVKESVDVAVQDSTSNFDNFVQDLMEILENIHVSLRKLTMSKSQDLYGQLDEINENLKQQETELNETEKQLSSLTIQMDHIAQDILHKKNDLSNVKENITDLKQRIEHVQKEISDKEEIIDQKEEENTKNIQEIAHLKQLKEEIWENIAEFQTKVESNQKEYEDLQAKLEDLKGIQNLFDTIEELEKNTNEVKNSIETKKTEILEINGKIENKETQKNEIEERIQEYKQDREQFWELNTNLQEQIEQKNSKLEKVMDHLRSLQNIQRMIDNIEELKNENLQSKKKIQDHKATIEELQKNVQDIKTQVDEKQQEIENLRNEKNKTIDDQKSAQKELNNINVDLQDVQNEINNLQKHQEREQQIAAFISEIQQTNEQIQELHQIIESNNKEIEEQDTKKNEKQAEIDDLIQKKDESWEKQKKYQKNYTDLKSDLSMEKSKLSNLNSKKIIINDQIEAQYQRSKDFGALPQITSDLSEEQLSEDIQEATKKKKALEPVNLKAIKEYDVIRERFDEIDMRRQTIQRERKSILDAIDKIELEKTQTFMKAYHEINREFSRIFQKLSPGGSAKMILDRPDQPFEGGISIEARPRGKKISSLEILSGGEKTLVALSFIFAVQEFLPAPFYVMDEIDAALDGPNVHRVSMLVKEFASQAQFLIISHREENIVNADRIYGVTMPQSGITDIFSVNLQEEAKKLLEKENVPSQT